MDFLSMHFSSGVETWIILPPLVAFAISFFTSMGGVSGAFLILPFQVSILGFNTASVSSTNLLYNIVGIPGGLYGYIKERRMFWYLTFYIVLGTMPGIMVGYYLHVLVFPDPREFKFFVGLVLLLLGSKLFMEALHGKSRPKTAAKDFSVSHVVTGLRWVEYEFNGEKYGFKPISMILLCLAVGLIGGIYGIGGGAIIAPFCVAVLKQPVHAISGAALCGTFLTSIAGVAFYSLVPVQGKVAPPDWLLGLLFGVGGILGMYLGARCQKKVPERWIKVILTTAILIVSLRYIYQYF